MVDKFDRHIAKGKEVEIESESGEKDVFVIQPLPFSKMGLLFDVMKVMSSVDLNALQDDNVPNEEKTRKFLEAFGSEAMDKISDLVFSSLKVSYPDVDEKKLEGFAASNLFALMPVVLEVNTQNLATK